MSTPVYFVERETPSLYATEPLPSSSSTSERPVKCRLQYLNEGGANFVFSILPDRDHAVPTRLRRRLLRIRKDLPHTQSAEDQLQALDDWIHDLFPAENVVHHELISLDRSVLSSLNDELKSINRPGHRNDDVLPEGDTSAFLVTDMTPLENESLLQLKPKWLAQSPNAPRNSKRCRTCALRAHRASIRIRTATDAQATCPLNLISSNLDERKGAVHAVTTDERLQSFLIDQAQPILHQLRNSQTRFDPDGVLQVSKPDAESNLCKAMTLRDCTLFLKRSGKSVEARLGDLDMKQSERLPRWKKVEEVLISEGWYANTESKAFWNEEHICQLSQA